MDEKRRRRRRRRRRNVDGMDIGSILARDGDVDILLVLRRFGATTALVASDGVSEKSVQLSYLMSKQCSGMYKRPELSIVSQALFSRLFGSEVCLTPRFV
jgi:hypothetical protein